MKAGYGFRDLTPALHPAVYLAGFGPNRVAERVQDGLGGRALALAADDTVLFLVAADLLGLDRRHCLEVQQAVRGQFPGSRLLLCCTHTHHGPDTIGFWGPDQTTRGVNPAYLSWAKKQIAAACREAMGNLQEWGSIRCASVEVPGVARNLRNPAVEDIELTVLEISDRAGQAVAMLVIFPCHPEVLSPENTAISSDYAHRLRVEVESGSGAPCLFFAGALGGMMSPSTSDRSVAGADHMGQVLAEAALQALNPRPHQTIAQISCDQHEFSLALENPLFQMAIEIGLLEDRSDANGCLTSEVNLIHLGPCWLAGVPGECFPELGLQIKQLLRSAGAEVPAVIGLANDELGYIMPQEAYRYPEDPLDPGDHYEETMCVSPLAGPRLIEVVQNLIDRSHR